MFQSVEESEKVIQGETLSDAVYEIGDVLVKSDQQTSSKKDNAPQRRVHTTKEIKKILFEKSRLRSICQARV